MEKNEAYKELSIVLEDELKIYLSLEESVFEFMEAYRKEPSETLKNIIENVIKNAMNQNIILLNLVSVVYKGVEKLKYSNLLGSQLNDLHDLEEELKKDEKKR